MFCLFSSLGYPVSTIDISGSSSFDHSSFQFGDLVVTQHRGKKIPDELCLFFISCKFRVSFGLNLCRRFPSSREGRKIHRRSRSPSEPCPTELSQTIITLFCDLLKKNCSYFSPSPIEVEPIVGIGSGDCWIGQHDKGMRVTFIKLVANFV